MFAQDIYLYFLSPLLYSSTLLCTPSGHLLSNSRSDFVCLLAYRKKIPAVARLCPLHLKHKRRELISSAFSCLLSLVSFFIFFAASVSVTELSKLLNFEMSAKRTLVLHGKPVSEHFCGRRA